MPTASLLAVSSDEEEMNDALVNDHARLTTILDIPGNSPSIQHHTIALTKDRKKVDISDDDLGKRCCCRLNRRCLMHTFIFISLINFVIFMYLQPILLQVHVTIPLTRNFNIIVNRVIQKRYSVIPAVYTERDVWRAPFSDLREPNIPHIVHQTWSNQRIPSKFVPFLLTWTDTHPDWEYWMWYDDDNEKFVKKCYPDLYMQYKDYGQNIHRLDVVRYLMLHQFGGVYADIDTKALRTMNNLTYVHSFILPKEPPEHAVLLWEKSTMAGNAILASRPGHPFIDLILAKLAENANIGTDYEVSAKTGSDMLNRMLLLYNDHHSNGTSNWDESVYFADSSFFLPTYADYSEPIIREVCKQAVSRKEINHKKICARLKKHHFDNQPPPEAYTNHRWLRRYSMIKQSDDFVTNYNDIVERSSRTKDVSKMIDELTFDEKTRRCITKKN